MLFFCFFFMNIKAKTLFSFMNISTVYPSTWLPAGTALKNLGMDWTPFFGRLIIFFEFSGVHTQNPST